MITQRNDGSTRVDVLGVGVDIHPFDAAIATLERWAAGPGHRYVCVTGAHGIMESRRNDRFRAILNQADMVTPDGMPLVWFARARGCAGAQRVYGPDLMRALTAVSERRQYRQFYYGGGPGLAEALRDALRHDHPGLEVVGTLSPPFRDLTAEEDEAIVGRINAARPDIVWVGLSTPKQEIWMADHIGRIDAPLMIGVGAAFDFLAGTKRQAPEWMQRTGLEWLFRLVTEPRRLWRRYAYIVPGFTFLALRALLTQPSRRGVADVRIGP